MNKSKQIILISVLLAAIFIPLFFVFGDYTPMEPLPGIEKNTPINLTQYLSALFNFAIAAAAILAVVMIVIGGLQYIGAAGNTSVIEDAKDRIYWAIVGLILALGSWMILNTINPELKELQLKSIEPVETTKEKLELLKLRGKFQTDIDMFSAKKCEELGPYLECEPSSLGCTSVGSLYCRLKPDNTGKTKFEGSACSDEIIKICRESNLKCAKFLEKDGKTIVENCI